MLHLLANPGTSPDLQIVKELINWLHLTWWYIIGGGVLLMGVYYVILAKFKTKPERIMAIPAIVVGIGVCGAMIVSGFAMEAQHQALKAKYDASVVSWLDTGYGIKTNTDIARQLIHGKSFTVTYHGQEIVVAVTEKINGDLALVDQNHTVLQPKS